MQIDIFIQNYFKLIVEKAKIYKSKGNIFNVEKTQNSLPLYLKQSNLNKLLLELDQTQYLNKSIFDVTFFSLIKICLYRLQKPERKAICNIISTNMFMNYFYRLP